MSPLFLNGERQPFTVPINGLTGSEGNSSDVYLSPSCFSTSLRQLSSSQTITVEPLSAFLIIMEVSSLKEIKFRMLFPGKFGV